jgi:lactate 2-monooxygenase
LVIMRPKGLLIWVAVFSTRSPFIRAQSAQELISSILNPKAADDNYSSYSTEIYYNHTIYNQTPIASTNYDRLEASAKQLLPSAAYEYARGGAGLEKTLAANRDAFDRVGDTPISSAPLRLTR